MRVLYIDYPKLHESTKKRILFLQAIINLISTDKNSITYYELGLLDKDIDYFAELLNREFKQFFMPLKDHVDVIDSIDGEIIIGTHLLMQDLKEIQSELISKSDVSALIEKMRGVNRIDTSDLRQLNKVLTDARTLILIPNVFRLWLFKYIRTPLIPNSNDGLKIYQTYLKNLNEDQTKQLFNLDILREEIGLFPERKKRGELDYTDMNQIISFINEITKEIENRSSDPHYWFDIRHKLSQIFRGNIPQKGRKIQYHFSQNHKIFLVEKGDTKRNPRNPVISRYHGKIVLFNDTIPLSKKLRAGDIVLGTIIEETNQFRAIIVNPERVLHKDEAQSFLERGIGAVPSRNIILEHLRGG